MKKKKELLLFIYCNSTINYRCREEWRMKGMFASPSPTTHHTNTQCNTQSTQQPKQYMREGLSFLLFMYVPLLVLLVHKNDKMNDQEYCNWLGIKIIQL